MELLQTLLNEMNLTRFSLLANPILSTTLVGISIFFLRANITAIKNQNDNAIRSERNERFKNAIEQLGSKTNAVALGGIYTLHRIAKEDKSYRENVFNILCSFVRDVTTTDEYKTKYTEKPSEPIQTILNILCINENDFKIYKEYRIDFSGANLTKANLVRANLTNANLIRVNLTGAGLTLANLTRANLWNANLRVAYLKDANFTRAVLKDVNLTNTNLENANLTMVNLFKANLICAYLHNANLTGADLLGADLIGANLWNVNLKDTNLKGTWLKGAISFVNYTAYPILFENIIMDGIGQETNLSGIKGGYDKANPPFKGIPLTGSYTEEEAKQMIEEYKKSLI